MRRLAVVITLLLLVLVGCSEENPDAGRQDNVLEQVRNQRPIPEVQYSQTYDTIVKWMERWNVQNKVSYVYLMADNGQMIGYYVAQGRPVSTCTFLTSPVKTVGSNSRTVVPAPALDGVYYGNCGESSHYFFTADTDAFIEIGGGMKFFVTDQPLAINVEELKVE